MERNHALEGTWLMSLVHGLSSPESLGSLAFPAKMPHTHAHARRGVGLDYIMLILVKEAQPLWPVLSHMVPLTLREQLANPASC